MKGLPPQGRTACVLSRRRSRGRAPSSPPFLSQSLPSFPLRRARTPYDKARSGRLFSDDLNQRAFLASAVELAVEDLLPRSKVELAAGDGNHHFASHHLPLHVRVRIVFAGAVVPVLRGRLVGREPFEPFLVIRVQARLIVVDEHGSRDVHGIDQHQTFLDTAFPEAVFHLPCDIEERAPAGNLKPQFSAKGFHPAIVALLQFVGSWAVRDGCATSKGISN